MFRHFCVYGIHFTPPFPTSKTYLKNKVFRSIAHPKTLLPVDVSTFSCLKTYLKAKTFSIAHHKTLLPVDVSTFLCRWTGRNRKRLVATTTAGRSASWPSCTTSPGPPPSGPPRRAPCGPWREPPSGGSCSRPPAKRGRCTRVS